MRNPRFALAAGVFLAAISLSVKANADARIRSGVAQVLWTYYETTEPFTGNHGGNGDNIIRLINVNGGANTNLTGDRPRTVCAMIYVFDDDEEMGECSGCPLSSAQLATFSVEHNLTSDWGVAGGPEEGDHDEGAIAIISTDVNPSLIAVGSNSNGQGCLNTQSGACNAGCDPTNSPGYKTTTTDNLAGSITHNQTTVGGTTTSIEITGVTETELSGDAGGDAINLTYLQIQCGALVGNGSSGGICTCPAE